MPPSTSRSRKAARSRVSAQEIQLATLQQKQDHTTKEFQALGDKFDKILDRLEQLTLNSTMLISRHDTQIQTMQKQLNNTESTLGEMRVRIDQINTNIATQLKEQNAEIITEMSEAFDKFSTNTSEQNKDFNDRLSKLERWRWMLIGAGLAIGLLFTKIVDVLKIFL